MNLIKTIFPFLFSFLVFFGCNDNDTSPLSLEVSTADQVLRIHNGLESKVYYFIVERADAELINWAPSVDGNAPCIEPKKSVEIQFEDIQGYDNDAEEVIVYYWMAMDENGSLVPGEIQSLVVGL
ncbi:hypothetical protein FNH22_19855 [Fulvivirga sp. M361]|uniref:hypothetical protein n=1 Tax=Fulvivirga sp. M361 TaxID=2594266 RepID=UPI00117B1338|nr:hypothetical protein [Fulvivirga sp. M361]TRX54369.1 hypothetical protein FNH22_19855 [Fulvivirga sp. M361]